MTNPLIHLLTYVLAVLALFLVPGPAVLLTLTQSLSGGRKAGFATSLGIALGDGIHTLLAALGLSALLMTVPIAFTLVKVAGVLYLVYLGVRTLFRTQDLRTEQTVALLSPRRAFFRALFTEVLNPRTALFFLAFLPQFIYPESGPVIVQLLILGVIFVALSIVYTTLLVLAASTFGSRLMRYANGKPSWQRMLAGSVYIGLGIRLAFQQL